MKTTNDDRLQRYVETIRNSGLTIYDSIGIDDPSLWIPTPDLELLLNKGLVGVSLANLAIRTRSKVAKEYVCKALGYRVPSGFKKTQPRFPGQNFDTYVQKSDNLQVWNEKIVRTRRYVIIRLGEHDQISRVRVVTGDVLEKLDTTGTLTQKFQARLTIGSKKTELISEEDTDPIRVFVSGGINLSSEKTVDFPQAGRLLPLREIYLRLQKLIGARFADAGIDQERNRGFELHRLVCQCLGYRDYRDDGQFPDVNHQLLEVKLQTSPTIDLGLVCPNSEEVLHGLKVAGQEIRHCDVRYALFYAETDGAYVTLTHLFLTTGKDFFSRFQQFQGNIRNRKLQIPLPADFFDG